MPRRNKNKNKNKQRTRNSSGALNVNSFSTSAMSMITHIKGQGVLALTIISGQSATAIQLSPDGLSSNITRFGDLMEAFQLYRFTSIVLRVPPPTIASQPCAVGYSNGDLTVTAASTQYQEVAQLQGALFFPPSTATTSTHPVTNFQTLKVGRGVLIRDAPNKWWRTQPGTAVEAWEENQGEIVAAVGAGLAANGIVYINLYFEIELTSPVPPNLIPKEPQITDQFVEYMCRRMSEKSASLLLASTKLKESKNLSQSTH